MYKGDKYEKYEQVDFTVRHCIMVSAKVGLKSQGVTDESYSPSLDDFMLLEEYISFHHHL